MKPVTSIRNMLLRFRSKDDGVAAIEFSLFTPILFFSLLATIDIGFAVNERMTLDQVLRAGAEQATYDPGTATIKTIIEDSAKQSFSVGGVGGTLGEIAVTVSSYCSCPDAVTTAVACSTLCTGDVPTSKFYDMSATKTYNSIIIPTMDFGHALKVQVR